MASKIQTVKGTREFYPEEMALRNYIYDKVAQPRGLLVIRNRTAHSSSRSIFTPRNLARNWSRNNPSHLKIAGEIL